MATRTFDFENGTNGATITNADLGSGSVVLGSGTRPTFSNTWARTGSLSARFNSPTNSSYILSQMAGDRLSVRLYARFNSIPASNTQLLTIRNSTTGMAMLSILSSGELNVQDSTGDGLAASGPSNLIPTDGTVVRIGLACTKGTSTTTGTIRAYLAYGEGAPVWTYESVSVNSGTEDVVDTRFGLPTSGGGGINALIDSVTFTNETDSLLGPIVQGPTIVVSGGTQHMVDARASTPSSGGTLSYSISQDSGPAYAPVSLVPGVWTIPPHATTPRIYQVTVAESPSGQNVTQFITVPAGSASSAVATELVWDGSTWT